MKRIIACTAAVVFTVTAISAPVAMAVNGVKYAASVSRVNGV